MASPMSLVFFILAAACDLRIAVEAVGHKGVAHAVRGSAEIAASAQKRQAEAGGAQGQQSVIDGLASGDSPSILIQDPGQEEKTMRVCNAFVGADTLGVTHVRLKTQIAELGYKECTDVKVSLKEDDQLDFMSGSGNRTVGTFAVQRVPRTASTLLVVVHDRSGRGLRLGEAPDQKSGATFSSHVYTESAANHAQIAVIDTSMGSAQTPPIHIAKVENETSLTKPEILALNSVVSVAPGSYKVMLRHDGGADEAVAFSASPGMKYVVLHTAEDATVPASLVVFPKSVALRSARAAIGLFVALLLHSLHLQG